MRHLRARLISAGIERRQGHNAEADVTATLSVTTGGYDKTHIRVLDYGACPLFLVVVRYERTCVGNITGCWLMG